MGAVCTSRLDGSGGGVMAGDLESAPMRAMLHGTVGPEPWLAVSALLAMPNGGMTMPRCGAVP